MQRSLVAIKPFAKMLRMGPHSMRVQEVSMKPRPRKEGGESCGRNAECHRQSGNVAGKVRVMRTADQCAKA